MTKLNKKQLGIITKILDKFEWSEAKNTGVSMHSGGFAQAEMFDYDDEYIDIELKWGIQSDCEDTVHTEQYKLAIDVINNKGMSLKDKVLAIEDA